ncbi:hypothetical protein Hdeb2414_s0004g00123931 [Helianthus debilis subsp. tardiflorus]
MILLFGLKKVDTTFTYMDPNSNNCSFLKLIDVHHLEIVETPNDFATLLWGEQLPYGDGFVKVVMDSGLQENDYLLFNTLGPSTWYLDVFKSCILDNSFITSIRADDDFILSTMYEIITFLCEFFFFAYFV